MNEDPHIYLTGKMGEMAMLKNLKTKRKMEESELPKSERIQQPQIKNNEYLKMYRMKIVCMIVKQSQPRVSARIYRLFLTGHHSKIIHT